MIYLLFNEFIFEFDDNNVMLDACLAASFLSLR